MKQAATAMPTPEPQAPAQVPKEAAPRCDASAIARRIKGANPSADPEVVVKAVIDTLIMLGCGDEVPPVLLEPSSPVSTQSPPPAYASPPGPAFTNCMPFGNGGTRCTTRSPGGAPTYTTCMPFGRPAVHDSVNIVANGV
jgi:hypothetical protein